ncbi:MAG: glmU3 [Parachlamydiales bacterium]|nr:glmU3 [Parachlamydiales bacterium]
MRNELKSLYAQFGQEHLIDDVDGLNDLAIIQCIKQIHLWNASDLLDLRPSWDRRTEPLIFETIEDCPSEHEQKKSADARNIAVVILAGGQGSRLGTSSPKGCFPILGKSLFERHAEKIRVRQAMTAILTSSINHSETAAFFEKNHSFGLKEALFFFQKTLPFLDDAGRWFWEAPGRVAEGADGNGSVFRAFEESGIAQRFQDAGVEAVHIVPVDNPLADPLDPILSSFHFQEKAELTIKCIRMSDPDEPMGRLVRRGSRLHIAEFAELSFEQRRQNLLANTGILAIDLPFMRHLARQTFPLHWAHRMTSQKKAWKAERFIVDALLFTEKSRILCSRREDCFAPLKEKNSIPEIERLLLPHQANR